MAKNYVFIKSNKEPLPDGSHPLAIRERDAKHPKGEIWVSGAKIVKAFLTAAVIAAIRNDHVVEVSEDEAQEQTSAKQLKASDAKAADKSTVADKATTDENVVNGYRFPANFDSEFPYVDILTNPPNNVKSPAQLARMSEKEALGMTNIGEARLREINDALKTIATPVEESDKK